MVDDEMRWSYLSHPPTYHLAIHHLIINHLTISHHIEGGCGLNMTKLISNKAVITSFPLHDFEELGEMR